MFSILGSAKHGQPLLCTTTMVHDKLSANRILVQIIINAVVSWSGFCNASLKHFSWNIYLSVVSCNRILSALPCCVVTLLLAINSGNEYKVYNCMQLC